MGTPEPEAHDYGEHEIALRLLAGEAASGASQKEVVDATNRVLGHLHEPLTRWMGRDGWFALLARPLELARANYPSLAAGRVLHLDFTHPPHLAGVSDPALGQGAGDSGGDRGDHADLPRPCV